MDLGLTGRTVIVTGASGGIGQHIASGFAAEGADLVVTYRTSRSDAELVAKEVGERALVVPYELGDRESARSVVRAALDWTGRIDVLVNNAVAWGAMDPSDGRSFEEVPEDAWRDALRQNVEGALQLTREVTPTMRRRHWGRVVHISSTIVPAGLAGGEYYGAAKAALHGFSRSAAFSLGKDGDILSNVVLPGLTRTATNTEITDAAGDLFSGQAPIGRLLEAAEVANAIVYLGSAANTGITGQAITVSGGS
jgi:3-oxoacyl-[acyl-carrier protein] reductase